MNSRKNRFISGLLSFVMVFTLVMQVLPQINVNAANNGITLTIPYDKWENGKGYIDIEAVKTETINLTWSGYSGAECYKLSVRNIDKDKLVNGYESIIIDKDECKNVTTNGIFYNYALDSEDFDYSTTYRVYVGAYASESDSSAIGDYWATQTFTVCDKRYIELSPTDENVNSDKQTIEVSVKSNTNWYVKEDSNWISVTPESGINNGTIKITISANSSTKNTRTAEIIVYNATYVKETVTITQDIKSTLTLDPETLDFYCNAGEEKLFKVTSNESWEITECPRWLDCSIDSYTISNGTVTKAVYVTTNSENNTGKTRTGTIVVKTNSREEELEVSQASSVIVPEDSVSISPNWSSISSLAAGGIGTTFTVTSSGTWKVSSNVDWISFDKSSGNSGTSFTPTISANSGSYREGIITVTCGDASVEICVKQEGTTTEPESTPCVTSLSVSPTEGTLSTTYTFTAKAENTDTVVFYVSGYKIGEVTSSSGTFQCTYNKFTSGGDRVVYAYPCDEYGNEVRTSGCYQTADFTITVNGTLSPVKILTDSYQSIDVNTSFTVEWADTASVPNDVSYNIYVWYDGKKVGDIMNTSSHSKTIPASYFTKEGRYIIGIYAISDTWAASSGVSIAVNVTVNTPYVENFAISPNTVSLGGTVRISGIVYGNGSDIDEIIIKITNNSDGTGGVYKTLYPNYYKLDMADTPAIDTSDAIFTTPGTYSIKLYALNEGAVNEVLLGQKTLQVVADSKITLNTPVLGGASTISYGDDYVVSWNYDETVDYYLIGISGLTYSKTVDASNSSYTIPFSVFKQYLGSSGSYFTVYVTAMSNSDTYLPSAKESKTVYVSGDASEKAVIKSVTLPGREQNEVTAGEIVTFQVVTSTDVEAIRMKDGAGTFIINTWTSGYTDSGSNRTWTVTQKVSYAGGSDVDYMNRSLTFYSMIGNTEYNKCNVTFICVKDTVVGTFDITKPVNGSEQHPEKALTITWTTPDTGVDYYVIDITHNGERIDEDVFPYEVRNGNSYTLDGSYLIRDNNAWNIQVTGCKAGMADTSASVRFVLKCQHEKQGMPVEKYLSYTNTGSSSTHSVKTEKTYPCLECGMTNAKTETGTKAVNHNYITLDEGGKVCNQCWYVNSNGSFDVQYDMSLVTTNSNGRENVYANVGSDGNPVNVQSNRYVEVGDSITVWGVLGNSYLIEYPISKGTHKGFIQIKCIEPTENEAVVNKTYNQLLAENYIDAAFGGGKNRSIDSEYIKIYENEYMVSRLIAEREIEKSDTYVYSILQNANNSFWDNALHSYIEYFGSDADMDEWEKTLCYEFLYSCIVSIPNINEADPETFNSADDLWAFLETKTGIKDLSELNTESLSALSVDKQSLNKILSLGSDTPVISEALNTAQNILKDTGGKFVDTAIKSGVNALISYYKYLILQTAADIEIFDLLIDIYGNDSAAEDGNDSAAEAAILELKRDYEHAGLSVLMGVAQDIQKLGEELICDSGLWTVPGGIFVLKVKAAIGVFDSVRAFFMRMSGLSTLAEGSLNLVLMYDFLLTAKMQMRYLINKYEVSGRNDIESANDIVLLYDFIRGCQIFINQCAIDVTLNESEEAILYNEIDFIKKTPINSWQINPYYFDALSEKPSIEELKYPYKVLFDGYNNTSSGNASGVLDSWERLNPYEKKIIYNLVSRMEKFQSSDVHTMYILDLKADNSNVQKKFGLSVLYVNEAGMGLFFSTYTRWWDYTENVFYVLSKDEVNNMINGNGRLPNILCFKKYYHAILTESPVTEYYMGAILLLNDLDKIKIDTYVKKAIDPEQFYDEVIEEKWKDERDIIGIMTSWRYYDSNNTSGTIADQIAYICDKVFEKPLGLWSGKSVKSFAEVLGENVVNK